MASVYKRGDRYLASFYDHTGKHVCRSTRTSDKAAAKRIAAKWEEQAALRREGCIDPRQEALSGEGRKSIETHLTDYKSKLEAGGATADYIAETIKKILSFVTSGEFQTATNISADAVNRHAAELKSSGRYAKSKGRSARTIQSYLTAIKGFTGWMTKNGKLPSDPLATVTKPNPDNDRRLERRMLRHEEWHWLRDVTAGGDDQFGISGAERVLLYETAIQTGLRSNELRSLTRGQLYLTAEKPYITCKAGSTKNRKSARQYILTDLANRLRAHITRKAPKAPVFALPEDYEMAEMLRGDLEAARQVWLREARHDPEEFANREQSDFLTAKNHDGDSLDFHALRHTCGAWLALAGAHPKSIQSVMRHSSITLTMDTYGHLIPGQEAETVGRFSDLMGNDQPNVLRATGTTDATAEQPAARCAQRCDSGAVLCVSGATPCDGDDSTDASDGSCNPLPFANLSDGVQFSATGNVSTPRGIRTPDLRIRNPLLYPTELWARVCAATTGVESVPRHGSSVSGGFHFHGQSQPPRRLMESTGRTGSEQSASTGSPC